jgi:hypothetical protein
MFLAISAHNKYGASIQTPTATGRESRCILLRFEHMEQNSIAEQAGLSMLAFQIGRCWYFAVLAFLTFMPAIATAQSFTKSDRAIAQAMLRDVAADVKQHYYDPKFHGVDWGAKVRQAEENLKHDDSMDSVDSEIAALLDSLNDSHTNFTPPARTYVHQYGFRLKIVGDRCFVIRVDNGSDAEKKGLKRGDEVLRVNNVPATRNTLWRIEYITQELHPLAGLRLPFQNENGHCGTPLGK